MTKVKVQWGDHSRHTVKGFKIYMIKNPYYFESIFQQSATIENIEKEARCLCGLLQENKEEE